VVKGWHKHADQWDRMACVRGAVMLGMVDGREDSPTHGQCQRVFFGDRDPVVVRIPPGVWHGLKNIGEHEAFVVNVPSLAFNASAPDEIRIEPHGCLNFDWSRVDR
jgi:dTDP-4-dehydrorhamnose 3,5-epimerase